MVFYFYEEAMEPVCKISVDGLVPNSYHLSHWKGNHTPNDLKADTATEIAFKYNAARDRASLFPYANIITNNRFSTDGLLAVFTLLHPGQAEPIFAELIAAAEASAFAAFSSEEGVITDLLIQGLAKKKSRSFWRRSASLNEALCYKEILPLLPDILKKKEAYSSFWREPFDKIMASMTMFERGALGLEECEEERLTIVLNDAPIAQQAIDAYCKGDLFLLIEDCKKREGGYRYTLTYRYYAWAETVRRPMIPKIDMEPLAEELNRLETGNSGKWKTGDPHMPFTAALSFESHEKKWYMLSSQRSGACSMLPPETVIPSILSHLRKRRG